MQAEMRELPFDKSLLHSQNRGLGAVTNAALRASRGDLILQIQDDWVYNGPADLIDRALLAIEQVSGLELLRLTCLPETIETTTHHLSTGDKVCLYERTREPSESAKWLYSDTPHIKSRRVTEALGPYIECGPMQWSEYDMRERFWDRKEFRAGCFGIGEVFEHIGADQSYRQSSVVQVLGQKMIASETFGRATRYMLRRYSRARPIAAESRENEGT